MACHTFGRGVKVGPDLRGVTERREREWLMKFIRSSQSVIAAGDPTATALFAQFKQQQMPDWLDLTEAQIADLLDWLAASGPDRQEGDSRSAKTATPAEIESGRRLFLGEAALSRGGAACGSCHRVNDATAGRSGGTLGPDLTESYAAYQDGAMTQSLRRPCMVRMPESSGAGAPPRASAAGFLTAEESFALKAYLRHVAYGEEGAAAHRWAPRQRALGMVAPRATAMTAAGGAGGELLFRALPYFALALCFGGLALRYAAARRPRRPSRHASEAPDEPRDPSRQIAGRARAAWRDFGGGPAWRAGLAGTLALHLVALAFPQAVLALGRAPWRLYLLEGSGALFGALALAGWVPLLLRGLHRERRPQRRSARLREVADCLFLALCCSALLSGLLLAAVHRWGSQWGAVTLTPYLQSLARGAPVSSLVEQLPLLVRVHVVSWFALLAVVPACSAADLAVHAVDRLDAAVTRPLEALRRGLRRARGRLSPARWLWPEED